MGALFGLVFLPFAGSYFLSFLYRSINAVLAPDLVADVGLDATRLGLLTAAFFLPFAAVQIPLGVLLDRYGAGRIQAVLLCVAAAGAVVFGMAPNEPLLITGRALIGVGCAGGLMAAFKAILSWYPPDRVAFISGCYLAVGGIGAMAATQPVEQALQVVEWRTLFLILAGATILVALLLELVVPDPPRPAQPPPLRQQVRELGRIYSDALFWRVAPISVLGMGGSMAVQGLWAGPWLADVAGLDRVGVANRLLAMTAAITVGFVATGWIGDRLRARGVPTLYVIIGGTLGFIASVAAIAFEVAPQAYWPWIGFGLFGLTSSLVYPLLARHFGSAHAGRANTGNTLLVFAGTFALQAVMGAIIDQWPQGPDGGYPTEAHRWAMVTLLGLLVAALIWLVRPGAVTTRDGEVI